MLPFSEPAHVVKAIESCAWLGRNPGLKQLGTMPGFVVELLDPLTLIVNEGVYISAPVGWVSDLTSIPGWTPISKEGRWTDASIIHDVLYAKGQIEVVGYGTQYVDQQWADMLYYVAMRSLGVSKFRAGLHYGFLRALGWRAWNKARSVQDENRTQEVAEIAKESGGG